MNGGNIMIFLPVTILAGSRIPKEAKDLLDERGRKPTIYMSAIVGLKGQPPDAIWLALYEETTDPAVAFLSRITEECTARWGRGVLDLEQGQFVWLPLNIQQAPIPTPK